MKRKIFLILALIFLPRLAYAEFPEKVTIRDRTIESRTVEEIRKLGFECEDVPWRDNAARVYIDAMNLYKDCSPELRDALAAAAKTLDFGEHAEEARRFLEDNRQVLDLLKQADGMPKYEFPMHKPERVVGTQMLGLVDFQRFGILLASEAVYDFSTGKSKDALDESFLALRLGKRVSTGHFLITWLVGVAVESVGWKSLDRMTASGKLDEPTLKDIGRRLDESAGLGDLTRAFRHERIWTMKFLEDMEKLPPEQRAETFERMGVKGVKSEDIQWDVARKNMTEAFDFYDTRAKKSVLEALRGENSIEAFKKTRAKEWDTMTRTFMPGLDKLFVTSGRGQVVFEALRIRVALERFKLAKGAYPRDLAGLVPQYLDKLPTDPFSGRPYGYRLEVDGNFLLWSVGEDLKDDGGKGEASNPWTGPDYVFTSRREGPQEPPK